MILKGLKQNSNEKYIESQLKGRKTATNNSAISYLGVLVNSDEYIDYEWFKVLGEALNIKSHKIKIIIYTDEDVERTQFAANLTFKDDVIGWGGTIKDLEIKTFVDTKFDALISYYKQDKMPLKLITAASKAAFKIGVFENDDRLNDLIIKTNINDVETFEKELVKYLQVLKRI